MTAEQLWYRSFRAVKKRDSRVEQLPPRCLRMCRRPRSEQWAAVIDLAIEWAEGTASWRHARITLTRERYWFFRGQWWLLTDRHEQRARLIMLAAQKAARHHASSRHTGLVHPVSVCRILHRWKASGKWRRIAAQIRDRKTP